MVNHTILRTVLTVFFMLNATAIFAAAAHHTPAKKVSHHRGHNKKKSHGQKKYLAKKVRVIIPNREPANPSMLSSSAIQANNTISKSFVASVEERLVNFVHHTVGTLSYSMYKLGGSHFDTSRGVYIVDCSSYIDNIIKKMYPHAYDHLVNSTGSSKPTTYDYYNFINDLDNNKTNYWNKIDDVEALRPGDVLVFRYTNSLGDETGGHMMIVMDKPIADEDAYLVRVADSAATGHTEDTRKQRASGIGIGTIVLKVDQKTYQPTAFAWRVGSRLKSVNVAMARPIDNRQATIAQTNNTTSNGNLFDHLKTLFTA